MLESRDCSESATVGADGIACVIIRHDEQDVRAFGSHARRNQHEKVREWQKIQVFHVGNLLKCGFHG